MKKPNSNKGKRPYNVEFIVAGLRTIRAFMDAEGYCYINGEIVYPYNMIAKRIFGPNGGCSTTREDSWSRNGNWTMYQASMGRGDTIHDVWVLEKYYDEVRYY